MHWFTYRVAAQARASRLHVESIVIDTSDKDDEAREKALVGLGGDKSENHKNGDIDRDESEWMLIRVSNRQERELAWLLDALRQETLQSLQEGVDECLALLAASTATGTGTGTAAAAPSTDIASSSTTTTTAGSTSTNPTAPPSQQQQQQPSLSSSSSPSSVSSTTLVVSTHLSEAVKGFITRSGTSIVKGSLSLNLATLPTPTSQHAITSPYPLPALTTIYSLLADCRLLLTTMLGTVPMTAPFLSDQLLLLSDLLSGVSATLSGKSPEHRIPSTSTAQLRNMASAPQPRTPSTLPPLFIRSPDAELNLSPEVLPPPIFSPALPQQMALTLSLADGPTGAGFVLTARTLASAEAPAASLRERLGLVQAPRHDELGADVLYGDRQVRVREKIRVHMPDPGLVSLSMKINAMARVVTGARQKMETVLAASDTMKKTSVA